MARAMTAELDIQFDGQVLDVDASDQDEAVVYPAQQCAQGFLDQLTAFADDLALARAWPSVCLDLAIKSCTLIASRFVCQT